MIGLYIIKALHTKNKYIRSILIYISAARKTKTDFGTQQNPVSTIKKITTVLLRQLIESLLRTDTIKTHPTI